MEKIDPRIHALIKQIVSSLVTNDYLAVQHRSNGIRLTADQLDQAISGYGRTLVMPPDTSFRELDAIQVSSASKPTWSINFSLWTQEEGRSDLTLECTVIDRNNQELTIEIDNLHVL